MKYMTLRISVKTVSDEQYKESAISDRGDHAKIMDD
jgi:hypothetical protein